MKKRRASNVDKRNVLLIRGSVGAGLFLSLGGMLLAGCGRGGEETIVATPAQAPGAPTPGPGGIKARVGPHGVPSPLPGPGGVTGQVGGKKDPFAPPTGAKSPAGSPTKPVVVIRPRKGFDPFYPKWTPKPIPLDPFSEVQPIRVASFDVEIPTDEPIVVREVADRRVSGIMSGDGVFAIIEQNGSSEVVKPGGTTADGYRVISINDDSVKLQKKEGNVIRTQVVQLSDIQSGGSAQPFGRSGNFGSGTQGGFPRGFTRPGGPGRPGPAGGGGKSD